MGVAGTGGLHRLSVLGCRLGEAAEAARTDRPYFLAGSGVALGTAAAGRAPLVWEQVDAVLNVATSQDPGQDFHLHKHIFRFSAWMNSLQRIAPI
jgi:hypothetical protein